MSVDTRAHIASATLQERAVLRRTQLYRGGSDGSYRRRKSLAIRAHNGEEVRLTLEDLGAALRVLGVSWQDLGYKQRR